MIVSASAPAALHEPAVSLATLLGSDDSTESTTSPFKNVLDDLTLFQDLQHDSGAKEQGATVPASNRTNQTSVDQGSGTEDVEVLHAVSAPKPKTSSTVPLVTSHLAQRVSSKNLTAEVEPPATHFVVASEPASVPVRTAAPQQTSPDVHSDVNLSEPAKPAVAEESSASAPSPKSTLPVATERVSSAVIPERVSSAKSTTHSVTPSKLTSGAIEATQSSATPAVVTSESADVDVVRRASAKEPTAELAPARPVGSVTLSLPAETHSAPTIRPAAFASNHAPINNLTASPRSQSSAPQPSVRNRATDTGAQTGTTVRVARPESTAPAATTIQTVPSKAPAPESKADPSPRAANDVVRTSAPSVQSPKVRVAATPSPQTAAQATVPASQPHAAATHTNSPAAPIATAPLEPRSQASHGTKSMPVEMPSAAPVASRATQPPVAAPATLRKQVQQPAQSRAQSPAPAQAQAPSTTEEHASIHPQSAERPQAPAPSTHRNNSPAASSATPVASPDTPPGPTVAAPQVISTPTSAVAAQSTAGQDATPSTAVPNEAPALPHEILTSDTARRAQLAPQAANFAFAVRMLGLESAPHASAVPESDPPVSVSPKPLTNTEIRVSPPPAPEVTKSVSGTETPVTPPKSAATQESSAPQPDATHKQTSSDSRRETLSSADQRQDQGQVAEAAAPAAPGQSSGALTPQRIDTTAHWNAADTLQPRYFNSPASPTQTRETGETSLPVTAHEARLLAPDVPKTSSGSEILLHVAGNDQSLAAIRVADRAGTVSVSVHTADPVLRESLRSNLSDLSNQLNSQGWKADVIQSATAAAHSENQQDTNSGGERSFSQQHSPGGDRQAPQDRRGNGDRWQQEFDQQFSGGPAQSGGRG